MKVNSKKIYQKLAEQNGVTPEEVRRDMADAIRYAYENPPNERTAQYQKQIPCKGKVPTPEEIIDFARKQITKGDSSKI